jgi:hypothetical protein
MPAAVYAVSQFRSRRFSDSDCNNGTGQSAKFGCRLTQKPEKFRLVQNLHTQFLRLGELGTGFGAG